ncbi:hypothetical protein AGMMS49975_20890 [Clostridia bacterium]|nr:hypothetical protein AGMMS49975_20890 [Clostridia bacterium]
MAALSGKRDETATQNEERINKALEEVTKGKEVKVDFDENGNIIWLDS